MDRILTINEEQAIEWWLSDNKALQTLVLQVYTEKELQRYINKMLSAPSVCTCVNNKATMIWHKLNKLAKLFNKDWRKSLNNKGYFVCYSNIVNCKAKCGDFCILTHESVIYPGIVYFKDLESVKKAIKILNNDLYSLMQ